MNNPQAMLHPTASPGRRAIRRSGQAVLGLLLLSALAPAAWAQATQAGITITNTPAQGPGDRADDHYVPGTPVAYTLVVDNPGTDELRGAQVSAALPADIAASSWTCRAEGGARCGRDQGRGGVDDAPLLPAHGRVTYVWTLTVPAGYPRAHDSLDAVATLRLPPGVRAVDPGRLSARDSDSAQAPGALPAPTSSGAPAPTPTPVPASVPTLASSQSLLGAAKGGLADAHRPGAVPLAAGPFPSCGPQMYISQAPDGSTNTTLSEVDVSSIPFTLDPLGTGSVPYNAIGFRPADNFIYGIRIGNNRLVRIYSDGSTELMGYVSGLPATFPSPPQDNSYNAGEIGTDGYLYVKSQNVVSRIYKIDISNPAAPTATVINLTGGTVSGADFAWINNRLYTVNQDGSVAWINPSTGAVTTLPYVNGALGNVGALFGTPNGLYGSRNNPGGFYQFDLATGRATRLSGSPVVGSNDGAHCASAAVLLSVDVGVTKTNTPDQGPNDLPDDFFRPGTNVTYQIVVSNRGPVGVAGLRVADPLPPGITTASWTCAIGQGQGQCGAASGSGPIDTTVNLEFDESTRVVSQAVFTLTIAVPADYAEHFPALTNTTTITLPPDYTDPTPNDHTATDTDPPEAADLRVVKSTTAGALAPGQTINYTIVADNLGPVAVADAILRDTPNSHLDCATPATSPTCSATGTAQCPAAAALTRSALLGAGVAIPFLPVNAGSVTVTMSCLVTQ